MDEQTPKTEEESLREEIETLKVENEKMVMVLKQIFYEKADFPFISGFVGNRDKNGMPDGILVCPTYGVDWSVAYKRIDKDEKV